MKKLIILLLIFSTSASAELSKGQLIDEILKIVNQNINRLDNFKEVRRELDPLVNQLQKFQDLSAEESLERKIGSWKQLWTDDADDLRANNFFQTVDRDQTYQIVFKGGVFYNLTVIKTPLGRLSGFLRGVYSPDSIDQKTLNLEFTKLSLRRRGLSRDGGELSTLTQDLEDGVIGSFGLPFGTDRFPRGPVGAKGTIRTIYIDDFLRIDIGQNKADGVEDLFVLIKN
jgi:hypothetical protein